MSGAGGRRPVAQTIVPAISSVAGLFGGGRKGRKKKKRLGDRDKPLGKRRLAIGEWSVKAWLIFCAIVSIIALFFIVYFLVDSSIPFFKEEGLGELLFGDRWLPVSWSEEPQYGASTLIVGSLLVMAGSMVFAIPLGIASAIFISKLAPHWLKGPLKTMVEILAGIPSVVYGLFGLIVLVRWIKVGFDVDQGQGLLAASILLGVMALPTIITVAEDAISAVPKDVEEASLALGATRWQTISKAIVPSSISGITAAVILGMGRAMGETMAVMMVAGNTAVIPDSIYSPVRTITATLGIEMGEASGIHRSALFALAVLLFIMVLIINSSAIFVMRRIQLAHSGELHKAGKKRRFKIPDQVKAGVRWFFKIALFIAVPVLGVIWFGYFAGAVISTIFFLVYIASKKLHPKHFQKIAFSFVTACMLIVLVALGIILAYIIYEGAPALSWEFISGVPRRGGAEGGIYPAIVGSLLLTGGALLFAVPLGIGAGIYLAEYAREGRVIQVIRLGIDNLNGTPSIVFGLFGFAFFVIYMDMGISLLAGALTLGLMVLPTIIRTTEEAFKAIPQEIREGSYALGASKWGTIWRVVFPLAFPGTVTGIILSFGRAIGESAPILFTAAVVSQRFLPDSVYDPVMALSTNIFYLSTEIQGGMPHASGSALVLLIIVFITYTIAALIRKKFQKYSRW